MNWLRPPIGVILEKIGLGWEGFIMLKHKLPSTPAGWAACF